MDVKCEQCSAEYEFDDSLLGEKGTTVKCAACNHVFRVLPRRKDDSRPQLQVRYVRTGKVEALGSLRDLQHRIQSGEASVDDQIGRDGFPFRRLGDVPELRNFFALRGSAPASSMRVGPATPNNNHLPVSPTSMPPPNDPPRGPGGRTVLGVGPQNSQLPGAPRSTPPAQPAGARPNTANNGLAATQPGRAPTSDAPTATRPRPPDDASVSQAPTLPGTAAADLRAYAARSVPSMPTPPRMTGAPATPNAPANPANPVRLYLDEDERRPARATEDSSKIWLYAVILLVLAGGGWLGINMLSGKSSTADVPAAVAPRVEVPTPAPAVVPTPEAPATTGTGNTAALPTPAAQPQAQAPAAQPEKEEPAPEPSAAAEPAKPSEGRADASKSPRGGDSKDGKDPTDYGGWVTKGDRAFSRGELDVARTAYQSALALRATGSEANTGLGFTLLAEGRAKDAIPHFDRAAGSGYADASIGLGDAYRRLGQKSQAAEAYKDYLERLPNGSRASYAKAQLSALGEGGGGGGKQEKPGAPAEEAPSGSSDYRPAGETEAPAPEPSAPAGEGTP